MICIDWRDFETFCPRWERKKKRQYFVHICVIPVRLPLCQSVCPSLLFIHHGNINPQLGHLYMKKKLLPVSFIVE